MASISVYNIGTTSFSVKLTGLQTEGVNYTRQCYWVAYDLTNNGNSTAGGYTDITQGSLEGGDYTFTGMSPNHQYQVSCRVTRKDTGAYLTSIQSSNFYTKSGDSGGSGGGDDDDTPWTACENSQINVYTDEKVVSVQDYISGKDILSPYQVHRYPVKFSHSGYAHFYTTGDVDTIGYLSTTSTWKSDFSRPSSSVASDDNSYDGTNFDIGYYVNANTVYYIYVRGRTGQESGYVDLCITEPWELSLSNLGTPTATQSMGIILNAGTMWCGQVSFASSCKVTVSFSTSMNMQCWISKSSAWSHGEPTSDIVAYDDWNYTITFDAVAGQTYYIWLRDYSAATSGQVFLDITIPQNSIKKWSWSASNGIANASKTDAAYKAVQNKQSTKNFNRDVWKAMVDKVQEIRNKTVGGWDATYASFDTTRDRVASNGDFELTATMFNSLRNNLELAGTSTKVGLTQIPDTTKHDNAPNGTIPHPVESGKTVFGHYFITLTDYMNSCIDKL